MKVETKLKHCRRQRAHLSLLLLRWPVVASPTLPETRRVALDLLQMRRRRLVLLLVLLVVWRVLLLLRVVRLLLLLPALLLRWRSKPASAISRAVGVVHLHVVRHLVVRGRGHRRRVAPAGDCLF